MRDSKIFASRPVALCLGGIDPSSGAGLLRDVMTLSALGVYPMAVSLAETLQNGLSCTRIEPPNLDPVQRLEALAPHLTGPWGLKLSLCALQERDLRRLAATIQSLHPPILIWDPILAPSSGVTLHNGFALRRMAEILLSAGPWIVTPNWMEASVVADIPPSQSSLSTPQELAQFWLDRGARAVWLKGGHGPKNPTEDWWITQKEVEALEPSHRLPGERRGTGCVLSSTWLALRLKGFDERSAAIHATRRLRQRWPQGEAIGGIGRPAFWPEALCS